MLLYTTNPVQQDAFIQSAVAKGYKVVKLETMVDAAFINNVEMKWEGVQFVRVDADVRGDAQRLAHLGPRARGDH